MSVLDGPGEGTWSVFALKAVEERDAARDALAESHRAALCHAVLNATVLRATCEKGDIHVFSRAFARSAVGRDRQSGEETEGGDSVTEDEIQAIENHISSTPATAGMYAPVMLQWLRALIKQREELLRLAYIGEHYFPDLSWKTRCEELLGELHERKEYAEQVEQDWRDAKSEFGTATAKLRARVRELEAEVARLTTPAPKPRDLGEALLELDRRARYKAAYERAWSQAVLDGCTRQEAHEAAKKAASDYAPKKEKEDT